jgi:NYN domain
VRRVHIRPTGVRPLNHPERVAESVGLPVPPLDIASMTLKRQVDTIVLVTGDSDFVPAAKLARREGVEFLLDPLWQQVSDELSEHVDGLVSVFPKPSVEQPSLIAA